MAYNARKIEDGQTAYNIGETIELMLQVETNEAIEIGDYLVVNIVDAFGNSIGQATASLLGDKLYVGEFTIPTAIGSLYNINQADETLYDPTFFYLKDVWAFPNTTQVEYSFLVNRSIANSAIQSNSIYTISISSLNNKSLNKDITFTSRITPFHASVDDVISVHSNALGTIDPIKVAAQIQYTSKLVDAHYVPDKIYNQEAFDMAIRCLTRIKTAYDLLADQTALRAESKTLDTMEISKEYVDNSMMTKIMDDLNKCALIVLAGGLDTPYRTKTFIKGIFDPNRPQVGRAKFDKQTRSPYLNYTEKPFLLEDTQGNIVEVRGYRTVKILG